MGKGVARIITALVLAVAISSCINIVSNRICVHISKGSGNNYYEVEIYSNKSISLDSTNNFEFILSDTNNVLLESGNGRLDKGYSTWESYRVYARNAYIVVVRIDMTGDDKVTPGGDVYSYKILLLREEGEGVVSFSGNDNWFGL